MEKWVAWGPGDAHIFSSHDWSETLFTDSRPLASVSSSVKRGHRTGQLMSVEASIPAAPLEAKMMNLTSWARGWSLETSQGTMDRRQARWEMAKRSCHGDTGSLQTCSPRLPALGARPALPSSKGNPKQRQTRDQQLLQLPPTLIPGLGGRVRLTPRL